MSGNRLFFSSPGTSAGPAEAKRLLRWWDTYRASLGGLDVRADHDMPFSTSIEHLALGAASLGRSAGSINLFERRAAHAGRDGVDMFNLVINRGSQPTRKTTPWHTLTLPAGAAVLFDFAETGAHVCPGGHSVLALMIPRQRLRSVMPRAEDLVSTVLPPDNEALRLLGYYADRLIDDANLSNPAVLAHAGQSLIDLVALAFGAGSDAAETARHGGLRAARLAAVLHRIQHDYADPELTPDAVARRVGISTRYLHDLLQETGESFSERVQNLRLAKARALLSGEGGGVRRISDAAYSAGFGDLGHFNRMFRRKYGLTPTAARGREAAASA